MRCWRIASPQIPNPARRFTRCAHWRLRCRKIPRPPAVSSGLRVGTPALATRGLQVDDFSEVGKMIGEALTQEWADERRSELSERVRGVTERYPLYPQLTGSYAGHAAVTI